MVDCRTVHHIMTLHQHLLPLYNIKSKLVIPSQLVFGVRYHPLLYPLLKTRRDQPRRTFAAMATEKPPLKKRSVVSSFIYKYVDENGERKPKVALFRRSDKVNTYQ